MAAPKVFVIIKAMGSDEISAIEKLVADQKRLSLRKLLKLITDTDTSAIDKLDKEFAYNKIFGKKYAPEQDYTWRNELRLLMDVVEAFAARKMMEEEWHSSERMRSQYFLKYLVSKNLYPIVLTASEQLKKDAQVAYDFETMVETCALLFPYLETHSWNNLQVQEVAEQNNKEYEDAVHRLYLQNHRQTQIAQYGSKLYRYKENFKAVTPDPGLSQYFSDYEDPYTEYLSLRLQTIALPNTLDPAIYDRCLAHLEAHPSIPGAMKEKFILLNNLSAAYFFKYDYEQALYYNIEQLKIKDSTSDAHVLMLIYNYVSNFAHLERYEDALAAIAEHKSFIRKFPNQIDRFKYIEVSCYALKGDKVSFNKHLPKHLDDQSKMLQHHYRMLIAISFFLDREYDLAINEVSNISRGLRSGRGDKLSYQDGMAIAADHLGIFIDLYQKYKLDGDKQKTAKRIEQLKVQVEEFMKSEPLSGGLLFYMWMRKQLMNLSASISN